MHNNSQPRLDMHKIHRINNRFNFKIKQIRPDLALITTGMGEWYIEVDEPSVYNKKYIIVQHKNARFNTKKEHPQGRFYDYNWALRHINYHDNERLGKFLKQKR